MCHLSSFVFGGRVPLARMQYACHLGSLVFGGRLPLARRQYACHLGSLVFGGRAILLGGNMGDTVLILQRFLERFEPVCWTLHHIISPKTSASLNRGLNQNH